MTTEYREGPRRAPEHAPDRVPELTHYTDDGCVVWHACLSCPLEQCIYDDPRQGRGAGVRLRDAEIVRRYREGWTARRLAQHYGVHRRSIFRILSRGRPVPGARRSSHDDDEDGPAMRR